MWKHNEEAIAAVEEFNEKVIDVIGDESEFSAGHCMSMETDGTCTIIKFMGVVLWSSEDDEREFDKDTPDLYEPLLGFLKRKARETLEIFSRVLTSKTEGG